MLALDIQQEIVDKFGFVGMKIMKLTDVCDFQGGSQPPKDEWSFEKQEGYIRMLQIRDFTQSERVTPEYIKICNSTKLCDEDDILIARYGASLGKILTGLAGAYNVAIMRTIPDTSKVKKRYLYYYLKSNYFQNAILNVGSRAAQAGFNKEDLSKLEISCPSLSEQDEIINVLYKVEAIVEMRKQELIHLDELIKARFVELFGNPLDVNKVNYIFTECVEFNPKKSEVKDMQDVEVSFVPMECVGVDGSFSIKETGLVSDYYSGYTYFRDGDVLLAKITPCFENGKVAIATDCKNGIGFGTTEFHVSRPLKGITNSIWIKYLLKNEMVHDLATINMSGSAGQKRIQTPFFNKLKVYVPPFEEQEQFAAFVEQTDKSKFIYRVITIKKHKRLSYCN